MRVEWSAFALSDRIEIFAYVAQDRPRAAISLDDRIQIQVDRLQQFPQIGRLGRVRGTRELVVSGTPYVVAYRVTPESVVILRVLHGARLWPDELPE